MLQQFTMITPVWGKTHTELFLTICLPTLLAQGNLPKLSELIKVKYLIYTSEIDAIKIKSSEIFNKTKNFATIEVIIFSNSLDNNHMTMTWCHQQALKSVVADKSYAMFVPPDCIWSNQTLTALYNIVAKGYKIVQMSGLRVISNLFANEIIKLYGSNLDLTSDQIVSVGLKYLHHITNSHFFEEKEGPLMPANMFWNVGENCILARNFHLHPILIDPMGIDLNFTSTIDDDLSLFYDSKEEYVVTDSDEFICFELSPVTHSVFAMCRKGNIKDVADWAELGTNLRHRMLVNYEIKIHAGNIDQNQLLIVSRKADKVVKEVQAILATRDSLLFAIRRLFNVDIILRFLYRSKAIYRNIKAVSYASKSVVRSIDRVFFSSKGPFPWHWLFAVHRRIFKPLLQQLDCIQGNILYIYADTSLVARQISQLTENSRESRLDIMRVYELLNSKDYFIDQRRGYYECIVIRDCDKSLSADFLNILNMLLKEEGKIICNTTHHMAESLLPSNVLCSQENNQGQLGTKMLCVLQTKFRDLKLKLAAEFSVMRSSLVLNSLRIIFLPILIIVNPILSAIAALLDLITESTGIWAEKNYVLLKTSK